MPGAEIPRNQLADLGHRIDPEHGGIGTHVGDQADVAFPAQRHAFIQTLRDLHRAAGGEAELARGLLLQGGGGEGRRRAALAFLGADVADGKATTRSPLQRLARGMCGSFIGEIKLLEFLAVEPAQPGAEIAIGVLQLRLDGPVFARLERLDLLFALGDHAQCRRLHPAGGQSALHLAPQHRREIETDQIIQRTACLLRIDQVVGQAARVRHRRLDRLGRDFGKHHAMHVLAFKQAAFAQDLADVPADRLAFAIQVGRQIDVVGRLRRLGNRLDVFLVALDDLVGHGKVVLGIDRTLLGLQIAHMAVGSEDMKSLPRYLLIVFALAGDSTTSRFFAMKQDFHKRTGGASRHRTYI